jgi:type VI secretion system protein ImpI
VPGAAPRARADREPPNTSPDDLASLPGAQSGDVELDFIRSFSRGAGLPDDALAGCDPARLANVIGELLQVLTENAKQLLEGRQQAKQLVRSSDHTTIQATENNPLKFAPTNGEAMRLMFGPPTRSYLDARAAFTQAFDDMKSHQVRTYSAMQQAVTAVLAEFDPNEIEKNANMDRSLADMFGSRKGRLWDVYVSRWKVCTQSKKDGILGGFMSYFAENYDTQVFKRSQRP